LLGSLRRASKVAKLNCTNSAEFQAAALALATLRNAVEVGARSTCHVSEKQIARRTWALHQGVRLQQHLEQNLKLPHSRSLGAAVEHAATSGAVTPRTSMQMKKIAQDANSGRHQKWLVLDALGPQAISDNEVALKFLEYEHSLEKLQQLQDQLMQRPPLRKRPLNPDAADFGPTYFALNFGACDQSMEQGPPADVVFQEMIVEPYEKSASNFQHVLESAFEKATIVENTSKDFNNALMQLDTACPPTHSIVDFNNALMQLDTESFNTGTVSSYSNARPCIGQLPESSIWHIMSFLSNAKWNALVSVPRSSQISAGSSGDAATVSLNQLAHTCSQTSVGDRELTKACSSLEHHPCSQTSVCDRELTKACSSSLEHHPCSQTLVCDRELTKACSSSDQSVLDKRPQPYRSSSSWDCFLQGQSDSEDESREINATAIDMETARHLTVREQVAILDRRQAIRRKYANK